MLAENTANAASSEAAERASFFRQSGWLMIANITGGMLMWGVHLLGKKTGPTEYGLFGVYMAVATCVPSIPLQMVFAQQTAKAVAIGQQRQLSGIIRTFWLVLTGLWLACVVIAVVLKGPILKAWGVSDASGLWMTMVVVLLSLWVPIFMGVLQGVQNFMWLGWAMLVNGVARVVAAALVVLALKGGAVGMLGGVLAGFAAGGLVGIWQSRDIWKLDPLPINNRELLRQAFPLMVGFFFVQFLFTGDTMFVKHYFPKETGYYFSVGTLSRALIWLVGPLAAVMFPRIVHSSVKSQKTDVMGVVLLGTGVLAVCGAIGLSVLGPFVIKLMFGPDWVPVASRIMPWYAAAMVPLALANVLVNNLLARSQTRVVPFIVVLAVAYAGALIYINQPGHVRDMVSVLQTLGVFNLLLLGVCAWFTWRSGETGTGTNQ